MDRLSKRKLVDGYHKAFIDAARVKGLVFCSRKKEVALNIGGYKYDPYSKTYPVFINYEKAEDIAVHGEERGMLMPLFVRKNKDDETSMSEESSTM